MQRARHTAFGTPRGDVGIILLAEIFWIRGDTDFGTREPVFHYYVLLL